MVQVQIKPVSDRLGPPPMAVARGIHYGVIAARGPLHLMGKIILTNADAAV